MSEPYNPYSATDSTVDFAFDQNPQIGDASMVNQLTIVGILQIVLGFLELMMGGLLVFSGFFIIAAIKMQPPNGPNPPPEAFFLGMQIYYWVVGGAVSILSIIRIASGVGCFYFRGRMWLILSLIGGLLSVLTCYCSPFSIAMCIYGSIVVFSSGAKKAYALRKTGISAAEIKHRFMAVQYGNSTMSGYVSPTPPPTPPQDNLFS
jgi:hypothetical protein